MRNQVTEDTKTSARNTWRVSLTQLKDPATAALAIASLAVMFGTGVVAGAAWFVTPKVEALRGELGEDIKITNARLAALRNQIGISNEGTESRATTLDGNIGENNRRISGNGERIAHMKGTLTETTGRLNRLYTQVTKNTDLITDLRLRGGPDRKMEGSPGR